MPVSLAGGGCTPGPSAPGAEPSPLPGCPPGLTPGLWPLPRMAPALEEAQPRCVPSLSFPPAAPVDPQSPSLRARRGHCRPPPASASAPRAMGRRSSHVSFTCGTGSLGTVPRAPEEASESY